MGFDKPDLGFLIHLGIPKTLTDYYQQIGRAGRKLENADCVLISLPDDDKINESFITNKVPEQPISNSVLKLIPNTPDEVDLNKIDISNIDARRPKIKKIAVRLELDGYIQENDNGTFSKIKDESSYNTTSVEPLLQQARSQYQEVKDFLESDQCLMGILLKHFNQEIENGFNCNKCSSCIDTPKFIKPNRSDIDTIPEIFELEENYVPEKSIPSVEKSILEEPKIVAPVEQDYRLLPDGYIDHPLASNLRTYSDEESKKRNWPSYAVFPKKVVNEIVIRRPKNFQELKEIPGLGDNKINEFGEDILEIVKNEEE